MIEFIDKIDRLVCCLKNEILEIEPWGPDGIRVRGTKLPEIKQDWISALLRQDEVQCEIEISETGASIRNGSIIAKVDLSGQLSFANAKTETLLLREQAIHALSIPARHYKDIRGDLFHIDVCFESL